MGVNGGYGLGVVSDGSAGFRDLDIEGWLVGGQAGCTSVLDGGFVIGPEGSYDWADEVGMLGDRTTAIGIFDEATLTNTVNWRGELMARAGSLSRLRKRGMAACKAPARDMMDHAERAPVQCRVDFWRAHRR